MYLGSSTLTESKEYILVNDKFKQVNISYVPGLVKIFNELIDNSIDEYVRTKGAYATKLDIKIDSTSFSVKDNGRGIPVKEVETPDGVLYQPELAWTHARAGSNFEDENSSTIGTNGVGSMIASVFSKEFIGISNDGNFKCTVRCEDNNESISTKVGKPTGAQGTSVTIIPDVERFGIKEITEEHIKMVEQRLYNLSVSYPEITFKLNSKRIKINAKNFMKMFGDNGTIVEEDNFSIGVFRSDSDDFKQFSLMNGLTLSAGGTHVDFISGALVRNLRGKIIKKYKTIKPNDVKRKLFIVSILKDFKGPKYETQTKEKLTNPTKDITKYFENLDLDKFADRVYKNKAITDSIIDYFKIAEEYKKKQELKGLEKTKKKIKSEKYTRAVGKNTILLVCEGASAKSGLLPGVGRNGVAYYELKGKPMNVYDATQSKFTSNKELSELYQIIKNEGFEKIAIASDADLDGIAINGLLLAFFNKYLPEVLKEGKIFRFQTPVMALLDKSKIPVEWIYDLKGHLKDKPGLTFKYFKGLGGYTPKQLKHIIETDGMDKMMLPIVADSDTEKSINEWYSKNKADKRKEKILENDFDLIKI